jgi:adenylate cyclase
MLIRRFYRYFVLLVGGVAVLAVLALDGVGALRGLDLSSIDVRFAIRGAQTPHDVAVVGVDQPTFNYLTAHHRSESHWPFPRRLDARVISNLARAGAKVIAVDIQFTEPTDPTDDDALILAVRRAGNVVLATTDVTKGGKTDVFGGGAGLAYSRATPADGQLPLNPDGRIRQMRDQVLGLTTFALAAAERALGHPVPFPGGRNGTTPIDYVGPAKTVPTTSYWSVLDDRFPPGSFRGKVVVVGTTDEALGDIHETPTSNLMSGPEVQANAIDTVLRGFPLSDAPGWLNGALVVVLGLTAPLVALRRSALLGAGATATEIAVLAVVCQLAFDGGTIVGFAYPAKAG